MQFKKSILALSLVCAGSLSASDSNSIKHYGFSALFGYMGETILNKNYKTLDDIETISYGTVLGSLPGLVKELNDDKFSSQDMAYNFAGALTGALISNYVNNNTTIFVSHNKEKKATQVKLAYKF